MTRLLLLHCPDDAGGANDLRTHLAPVCRPHRVETSCSDVTAGGDVEQELQEHIRAATYIVVLVSAKLLAWSSWDRTVGPALARHEVGGVLLVRSSACMDEQDEFLRRFGPIPDPVPIATAANRDAAFTAVARRVSEALRAAATGPQCVALGSLPSPEKRIMGRNRERAALDTALDDRACHVVVVAGEGGAGKTQLVRTWLDSLQPAYGGVDAVISCSIEDQDRAGGPGASAAASVLLAGLGEKPSENPMESVGRLVRLVRARRTIVVIDGLEPLQDLRGEVIDGPMKTLIRDLASQMNGGLCVITTRPPFVGLDGFSGVCRLDLDPIDPASAIQVLRSRGVRGSDAQLANAAERLRRHALSLALVADYISEAHEGNVLALDNLDLGNEDIDDGGRLDRILSFYEKRLTPMERAVLGAVALCERPTLLAALVAIGARQGIGGFVAALGGASPEQLRRTCTRLERTALLSRAADGSWDQHPLVRGWWRRRLTADDPAGVRTVHERFFEWFRDQAARAGCREDLDPLYAAVAHGIEAQRWDASFEVLHDRIREGERHTSLKMHGAVAEDLRAFLAFFEGNNIDVRGDLAPWQRHWLENSAGVLLRAQGRTSQGVRLLERAVRTAADAGLPGEAAESARNLASVHSLMGNLIEALQCVENAVSHADASGQLRPRLVARDFRAYLMHRFGRLHEARVAFDEIEQIREREGADHSRVAHYPFASQSMLLLDLDEVELAHDRAVRALQLTHGGDPEAGSLLNRGLSMRGLARTLIALGRLDEAAQRFEEAEVLVRQSGRWDHLAPCHIDHASFWAKRNCQRARRHLAEARAIFDGRGFRLIEASAALITAKVALGESSLQEAAEQLDIAEALLGRTHYHLRVPRLRLLRARLCDAQGDSIGTRREADLARQAASAMGLRRRDFWQELQACLSGDSAH